MVGVLQEAGDADSRARIRSQMSVDYFIIPYTFKFIRLPHFYQQYYIRCIFIITIDEVLGRWGGGGGGGGKIFVLGCGRGDIWLISCNSFSFFVAFSYIFVLCCLMFSVPFI